MLSAMRSLWEWWKRVARRIGDVQARILLILFYFVILTPFALMVRLGRDPLAIKSAAPRGWRPRDTGDAAPMERAIKQF